MILLVFKISGSSFMSVVIHPCRKKLSNMPHCPSKDYAQIMHGLHFILPFSFLAYIIGAPMLTA